MTLPRTRLLLALALALLAWPAQAAAIDKVGAAKIKSLVENFIQEQKKLAEIDGVTKIEYQGEVMVEEAGDFYAVTLPYTKLINARNEQIDLGMISINASPADTPGQWKMRVAIPTPVVVTDKTGAEIMRVTIAGQRAAGIWDETLQSFVKLDAQYKDMLFAGREGNIKLPETRVIYDFTKDAAGKWSGPGSITFKNLDASGPHKDTMKIADAKITFAIDKYDSSAIRLYREKLAALGESLTGGAAKGQPSSAHAAAVANMMTDFLTGAGNGIQLRYDVTGLNLTKTDVAGVTRNLALPKGFLGLELGGFNSGKVRLALKGGHEGLKITPATEQQGLTPTESNIDIVIENIPVREIADLGKNTFDSAAQRPEMGKLAGLSLLIKLPALLSQAGTFMTVTDTRMGNADIDIKLDGRARADISAVNSATMDSKATIRGLDTLLARMKEKQKTATPAEQQKIAATIARLEQIKKNARVEKTADGQTLHVLELIMNPQGQLLLNGKDALGSNAAPVPGIEKPSPVPAPAPAP
ncbi:MAG: hypothetical protein WBK55_01160 [Alphaproteobacteria bacterium]